MRLRRNAVQHCCAACIPLNSCNCGPLRRSTHTFFKGNDEDEYKKKTFEMWQEQSNNKREPKQNVVYVCTDVVHAGKFCHNAACNSV